MRAGLSRRQWSMVLLIVLYTLALIQIADCAFVARICERRQNICSTKLRMSSHAPMVVVFGRPGSGKTTIADAAIKILSVRGEQSAGYHSIGIDLDVCVPQWMRDNFALGRYPTLAERQQFALEACDFVSETIRRDTSAHRHVAAVVSFSFVNADLRDTFRSRFPNSMWALVDTSESDAADRIRTREGHFYKGAPPQDKIRDSQSDDVDNSEWDFAPVTFPHIVLPGTVSVEENAERLVAAMQEACQR